MPSRSIPPSERAFFDVFTNRDLLREIAKYHARSVGDFIVSGRKCPFGPNFGLKWLDINLELIRAVHRNSPVYFKWMMEKLLEGHEQTKIRYYLSFISNIVNIVAQNFTCEIIAILMKIIRTDRYVVENTIFYLMKYPNFVKIYIKGIFNNIFDESEQKYINKQLQFYYGHDEAVFEYLAKLGLYPTCINNKNITLEHFKKKMTIVPDIRIDEYVKNNIALEKIEIIEWLHYHNHSLCGLAWLRGAIHKNDIELVKHVLDVCKISAGISVSTIIKRDTKLEIIKLLWPYNGGNPESMMDFAFRINRIDIIEWLNDNGHEIGIDTLVSYLIKLSIADFKRIAARIKIDLPMTVPWVLIQAGNTEMLKYLHEIGFIDIISIAPRWFVQFSDNLDIFKWIYGTEKITKRMTTLAACHGRYKILRWICETHKVEIPKQAFRAAIRAENIEMIEWILQHRPCPPKILSYVAKRQSFLLFQWFHERVTPDIEDLKLCMKTKFKIDILWLIYQNHGLAIDPEIAQHFIKFGTYDEHWKARQMLARPS